VPVTYAFRDGVLVIAAIGGYLTAELISAIRAAIADPRFSPAMSILLDGRSSLSYLSAEEVEARATWFATVRRDEGLFPRVAFVIPPDPSYRARITSLAVTALEKQGTTTRTFNDVDEALTWLRGSDCL
jgi:hypothetical protein